MESIVLHNMPMTVVRERNKICQSKWNILNTQQKRLENINYHKVIKRSELSNEIERISSDKDITDTEAIEQKSTSEVVMRRLKISLEREVYNEQLHYLKANLTIKELQEEIGKPMQTRPVYIL